jgi:RHS repeat-associated protein
VTPAGRDEALYGTSSAAPRGNATTVTRQCFNGPCASGNPTTSYSYDETGQVLFAKDPNTNTTQYFYADNYSSCGGPAPASGPTDAYLTSIKDPLGHIISFCYGYDDGQTRGTTDANLQTTKYIYNTPPSGYCSLPDGLNRLSEADYPDGGKTFFCYNDATYNSSTPSPSVTTTKQINSSASLVSVSAMDGLDHVVRSVLTSNPSDTDCGSGDRTDTTYDGLGHVYTVSNPYCTTGDPTYGLTTYAYDALGRATQITRPDNSTVRTSYAGPATQVQDEGNGTQPVTRISQTDALGRLTSVCEVSGTTLIGSSGTPAACGLAIGGTGFLTSYQYDPLDNLLQVNQPGITARTFVYDSLSRLTSSTNPESGTTAYSNDPNGNVITKTDARGISTTFAYDPLNRVNSKTYSDGTPAASFFYDNASCCPYFSPALQNTIGRLVYAQAAGQAIDYFSYDAMGRTTYEYQATPSVYGSGSYAVAHGYDLAGDITSATNGLGVTLTYSYPAGRLTKVTSSLSDWYHPATLLSGGHYNALGEMTSAAFGNGATQTLAYNNRTWVQSVSTNGFVGVTDSTGSATLSGSEQSILGAPANSGTGSVTFSGTLQSKQVLSHAATSGTGSVSIGGGPDQSTTVYYVCGPNGQRCSRTVYDSGGVSVTVNGFTTAPASYYQSSTTASIAASLASALNASGSPVTASSSGNTVTMTAKVTGAASDYPVSVSVSYDTQDFSHASFTASGPSALSGGANATYTTIYDSGTSTTTVNGHADTVSWSGSGTTTSSIASALASNINADSGASVTATASGSTVSMTAKTTGASTNYSLASSWTYDSADFSGPSFTSSNSGSTLTGGQNAGATLYDSGSVWITVNGAQYSVSYGQSSTATSLASSLAQAVNGNSGSPVTATASSTTVSLASKSTGSSTNYSLAVGSSTNQSSSFSQPSFSVAASGGSMVGGGNGAPATLYSLSLGYAPNGNVISANDSVNGNWAYAYDPFNRLTCSNLNNGTCASPTSGQVTYTYNYDRFGNRWQQNGPNSMMLTFTGNNPGSSINNNRMDGHSYDAAGNLLNDGVHGYTYDAENRVTQVDAGATATYIYDANGRRVRKTAGASVDYLYDISGHQIAEVSSSGGWNRGEVYAGGTHIATYNNGTTYFTHQDWLGTERVRSNVSGAACETISSIPFGDGQTISGSCGDPTPMHFTGKERDSESALDNFEARYFGSLLGRFMSADPDNLNGLIDQDDPQAWNGYAYARNNPLLYTDPGGTNYNVCDTNGKNCADLSDAQYDQFRKDNPDLQVTASGDIYSGNTKIGSESYYNEKDVQAAQLLSGPIQNVVTKAGYVVGGAMAAVYAGAAYGTYQLGTTALNLAGAGGAAAPILYKTGDIIDEVVQTPQGPVRIVADVVVEGTNVIIKDVQVYAADSGERLNVGIRNMLGAIRPLMDGLKDAGYTTLRILGDRSSAAGSANPGRPVDIFRTLR